LASEADGMRLPNPPSPRTKFYGDVQHAYKSGLVRKAKAHRVKRQLTLRHTTALCNDRSYVDRRVESFLVSVRSDSGLA
jgi:hypothetical protein